MILVWGFLLFSCNANHELNTRIEKNQLTTLILAGGKSSRMGGVDKGLLKINDKSLLGIQIEQYKKKYISEIIIITGPHHKKFDFQDVSLINDSKYLEHDVLGSLMIAKSKINEDVITSYSDIIFDDSILDTLLNFKGDIGITVDLNWEKKYLRKKN